VIEAVVSVGDVEEALEEAATPPRVETGLDVQGQLPEPLHDLSGDHAVRVVDLVEVGHDLGGRGHEYLQRPLRPPGLRVVPGLVGDLLQLAAHDTLVPPPDEAGVPEDVADALARCGLEVDLHLVRVVLGAGTSLFDNFGSQPIKLQRIEVIDAPEVAHLRFRVIA